MDSDTAELVTKLAMNLDACLDLVEAEVRKEARREAGKQMRDITWKLRRERIGKLLDKTRGALTAADRPVMF